MIADRSDYFKAARSSQWNKDPQVPTDLSDADPPVFQDYQDLVYTNETPEPDTGIPRHTKHLSRAERKVSAEKYFQRLVSLWVLADKLQDRISVNKVMDRLLVFSDASDFLIPAQTLTYVYNNTSQNSFLRMMVRDLYIYESIESAFDDVEPELPKELLRELNKEHKRLISVNTGEKVEDIYRRRILDKFTMCRYHQHKNGEESSCPGRWRR